MKKIVCIFLLLAILMLSAAVADTCFHHWIDTGDEYVIGECNGTYDTVRHTCVLLRCVVCEKCYARSYQVVEGETIIEAHQFTRVENLGHVGEGRHSYRYKCKKCPVEKVQYDYCGGPPCEVTPINKKPIIEEDQ